MASNINSTDIDALYPVAGQDNDSQGFRDNFTTIKNSLATAKTEITTLQENTAKLNTSNNFGGNDLSGANLIANSEEIANKGSIGTSQAINWTDGNYQTVQITAGSLVLTFDEWPESGKLGQLRLAVTSDNSGPYNVTFATSGGTMKYDGSFPTPFTINSETNPKIIEVWTTNSGTTVFARYIGEYS